MKPIFYILILNLTISALNIYAQGGGWYWSNPIPQGNNLNSVQFINQNTGFAVGNYGTLLKTTNAGTTWDYFLLQSPKNLSALYFVNSNVGYAVGDSGLILKTTNGGDSWINQISGTDTNLTSIYFVDSNIGFATGLQGVVLKTTDGGANWSKRSFYYNNSDVYFLNANNGFVVGDAGTLIKTTDGGEIWSNIILGTTNYFKDIHFINSSIGFIAGGYYSNGMLFKTTDGGITWNNIINNNPLAFDGIFFKDLVTGFIVGVNGTILKTTDAGENWIPVTSGTINDLKSGFFVDANNGFIVGEAGKILKTTDGGNSWSKITLGSEEFFFASKFLNSNFGLVVGSGGTILKTTDGGINWLEKNLNLISNPSIYDIHIFDFTNAVAVGAFGFTSLTTDGGETWSTFSGVNSSDLVSLKFVNNTTGFAAGYGGTIVKTTNAGINWSLLNAGAPSIFFFDIDFIDENTGFVCGSNGAILKTTDGGTNWSSLNSGTTIALRGIDFIDINNGIAVGDNSSIYKTSNGGLNWNLVTSTPFGQTYTRVKYVNPQYAILIGVGGSVLTSLDAGNTWVSEESKTNNPLYGLTILDSTSYIAVGHKGTIIKSINWSIPVELVSFNAAVSSNSVLLNWSTATELNNSGFNIERKQVFSLQSSVGNEEWNTINFVNGNGTTTEKHSYSFQDKNLSEGKYQYRIKQIDFNGTFEYSQIVEVEIGTPDKFSLEQNYPNPFNPSTKISYSIPNVTLNSSSRAESREEGLVTLKVYDVLGNEVATLVNEEKPAGIYEVEFNASNLSSGIYFYKLIAGSFTQTKKMTIIK